MKSIAHICRHYRLGGLIQPPEVVEGGTMHRIWRVTTEHGQYGVKRLNKANHQILGDQHLCVDQAQLVIDAIRAAGIPTHFAIAHECGLEYAYGGYDWVVYRWIEGECIDQASLSVTHAISIGEMLAKLHQVDISLPGLSTPVWHGLSQEAWGVIAKKALIQDAKWAMLVCEHLDHLQIWSERAKLANQQLTDRYVLSHRDLNIFNIIWRPDQTPVIIDWELGGLIHPYIEAYIVAMNWSYDGVKVDQAMFNALLLAYQLPSTVDLAILKAAYMGYLLDWMIFNIRRSLSDQSQHMIATREIEYVVQLLKYNASVARI